MTVLAPVLKERLGELRESLDSIDTQARSPDGPGSPFAAVPGIHVARWVVVDQLVNEAVADHPLDADPPMLLFGAVGDGKPHDVLRRLSEELPEPGRKVWTK